MVQLLMMTMCLQYIFLVLGWLFVVFDTFVGVDIVADSFFFFFLPDIHAS